MRSREEGADAIDTNGLCAKKVKEGKEESESEGKKKIKKKICLLKEC